MANPFQGDDEDPFSGVRDEEGNVKQTGLARTAKLSPFGLAFDTARKAGEKNFTFKGKKYSTDMGGSTKAPSKAPSKPAAPAASKPSSKSADMTGPEVASEKRRIQNRGGTDRLGESAFGRLIQRGMNKPKTVEKESGDFDRLMKEKRSDRSDEGSSEVVGAKKGGMMKAYKKGGMVKSSASRRADGCATKGKTKGRVL